MNENETIELLKKIGRDVGMIKKYARLQATDAITAVLNRVATTPERQQIWRLADGTLSNEQIANQIGVTLRSVQYFVQDAENSGLFIMEKRGYPKRIEDIIPQEWKPWKPKKNQAGAEPEPRDAGTETTEEKPDVQT